MKFAEQAIVFPCAGNELLGIVTIPEQPEKNGVLVVVGGPQYRAGSHRQFLLLSRSLATAGYPVMRFDHRGMGDSTGNYEGFEALTDDIAAAIGAFQQQCPSVSNVFLWGLCDAASASLLYWDETRDSRITGLILLNPWVRSEATLAKAHIKHYYGQRLLQGEFWRKFLGGNLGAGRALSGLIASFIRAREATGSITTDAVLPFQKRMVRALKGFPDQILLILSGDDYTAKEFLEAVHVEPMGFDALTQSNITQNTISGADHTFSRTDWRQKVESVIKNWLSTENGK